MIFRMKTLHNLVSKIIGVPDDMLEDFAGITQFDI